jgi:hypothetical protein
MREEAVSMSEEVSSMSQVSMREETELKREESCPSKV